MVKCPGDEFEIPDYRIYKVEDCPRLQVIEKRLAALGLKDPWLRNEVWRYNKKTFGTKRSRGMALFFRGFKLGLIACVFTIIGEHIMMKKKDNDKVVIDDDQAKCEPKN